MVVGFDISNLFLMGFTLIVAAVALSDLAKFTIPNILPGALGLLFIGAAVAAPFPIHLASHLGAGMLVFGGGFLLFRLGLMGGGDVKFWSVVALWAGLDLLPLQVVVTGVSGGVLALSLIAVRRISVILSVSLRHDRDSSVPRLLKQGAPVPYGLAIAIGAFSIVPKMSLFSSYAS